MAPVRPRRCARWAPHVLTHVDRPRFIMTVAAWPSARLGVVSPALVMPPETSRSPDGLRDGVSPTQGPPLFDAAMRAGSSTAERKLNATTAPISAARQRMPACVRGRIVIRRRQTGASWASWRTGFAWAASSCRREGAGRPQGGRREAHDRSIGPAAVSSRGVPSARSRMRLSNLPREIMPTLRPKFRSSPRSDLFRAIILC